MGYKQMDTNMSFAEIDLLNSIEHNRAITRLNHINTVIDWSRIDKHLMKHYRVGKSAEGADAYPPLLLLKCFLIQQWFHIDSDPELETQINDHISFKKFLGLSSDQPSPDHSTFSRFRNRLSKKAMSEINHEVLMQFASPGLFFNLWMMSEYLSCCYPLYECYYLCWAIHRNCLHQEMYMIIVRPYLKKMHLVSL
jgi:IS5 family transposase